MRFRHRLPVTRRFRSYRTETIGPSQHHFTVYILYGRNRAFPWPRTSESRVPYPRCKSEWPCCKKHFRGVSGDPEPYRPHDVKPVSQRNDTSKRGRLLFGMRPLCIYIALLSFPPPLPTVWTCNHRCSPLASFRQETKLRNRQRSRRTPSVLRSGPRHRHRIRPTPSSDRRTPRGFDIIIGTIIIVCRIGGVFIWKHRFSFETRRLIILPNDH